MIYTHILNDLVLKSGDLICTTNGNDTILTGQFWWFVGRMIPGDVDHIAVYIGPNGRCIEAGATGKVVEFECGSIWDADAMFPERGFVDRLYGVAYPLMSSEITSEKEIGIREDVVNYCLKQVGKPYNLNFFDSGTEDAFYCSQLAYKAYLRHSINFNMKRGILGNPLTHSIVFPQEVWDSCEINVV